MLGCPPPQHHPPGDPVYGLPGNNFAAYRWGDTIDTVYPALLEPPYVTHEQQTMGSLPTADLLEAVDTPLQEGVIDPRTLAPMTSLMSVGDVLVQYDLSYEMYDTPDPRRLALDFAPTPPGLSDPVSFGAPRPNVSTVPHVDEATLALPAHAPRTAPLVTYTVDHPGRSSAPSLKRRPDDRWQQFGAGQRVVGGPAGAQPDHLLLRHAGHPDRTALPDSCPTSPAWWSPTPTGSRGTGGTASPLNSGYTETAAEGPDESDPFDSPLDIFPGAPADAQSTTVFDGV